MTMKGFRSGTLPSPPAQKQTNRNSAKHESQIFHHRQFSCVKIVSTLLGECYLKFVIKAMKEEILSLEQVK